MDEHTRHEARQWLLKADHDLRSARRLMSTEHGEPILDTAVYHCQQVAEKALKAFLTAHETLFPKTHLLLPLLELCKEIDPSFSEFTETAEILTPFATEFRYPGDLLEPDFSDAEEALQAAQHLLKAINSKLRNKIK